jgi:hypothetical protein
VKDSWGGKGAPFPRAPIIDYKGIAAVNVEPGTFLGDNLVNTASEERFLDLSGWKTAAGMDEPKVTAASKNTYSNRSAVATRYDTGGDLADSKYWYHAEMFDDTRLRRLLSTVRAPNLVKVLDDLKRPDGRTRPRKKWHCSTITSSSRPTRRVRSQVAPMSRPGSSDALREIGYAWRCCSKRMVRARRSSRHMSG